MSLSDHPRILDKLAILGFGSPQAERASLKNWYRVRDAYNAKCKAGTATDADWEERKRVLREHQSREKSGMNAWKKLRGIK